VDSRALNRVVVVKQRAAGQDPLGQPVDTWTTVFSGWANVRHQRGAEALRGDKDVSIVTASIRMLLRREATAAMRVYLGAAVYEIKAVLPDEVDRDHMDLACELVNG
jgi:SPP1 family predicted phage head-tail adaptor